MISVCLWWQSMAYIHCFISVLQSVSGVLSLLSIQDLDILFHLFFQAVSGILSLLSLQDLDILFHLCSSASEVSCPCCLSRTYIFCFISVLQLVSGVLFSLSLQDLHILFHLCSSGSEWCLVLAVTPRLTYSVPSLFFSL